MNYQQLAAQHRAELLKRDAQLADEIARQYRAAFARFHQKLAKTLSAMKDAEQQAEENGQTFIPMLWWHQAQRLDTLLAHVQDDFGSYSDTARKLVQGQQHAALKTGQQDALDLLHSRLGKVRGTFGRPSEQALEVLINRGASHLNIADLFRRMDRQTLDLVRKRLIAGLLAGENPRQIAQDIVNALKLPLNRALTIARTELINAYRTAALDTYRANSDVVTGWTWSAAAGACPFCSSMNGTHHDLSETLDSHPNCRCAMLPDTPSFEDILAA